MIIPIYDIGRLRPKAVERLHASGQEVTDLNIYHMLAVLRTEEIKEAVGRVKIPMGPAPSRVVEIAGGVEVDSVEIIGEV